MRRLGARKRTINPLFLHGPSGTGKTHLLSALATAVAANAPDRTIALLDATDFDPMRSTGAETEDDLRAARQADVLLIEDLQHLPRAVPRRSYRHSIAPSSANSKWF